jgi:endonuclease G
MQVDYRTIARVRLAVREAIYYHYSDPNVTLIEFGLKKRGGQVIEDETAIRIHVRQKLTGAALETAARQGQTRPIPVEVGGFQTDVSQGTYYPHQWGRWRRPSPSNPRATELAPMRGGISISDERHHSYGTLGGLVVDQETGVEMMLSNWHVLAADWLARPGQRILQPGRLDGGTPANTVATLARDAMSANLDAAVATLNGGRPLINHQLDLGPIQGVAQAELGMEVVKSGRRTSVTSGRIMAVEGVAKMRYGHVERLIRQVVRIEPLWPMGQVSGPGDSGSVWLDKATMQAVGLHFAGGDFPERALAIDMPSVLDALKVDLVTGVPLIVRPERVGVRRLALVGV